MKVLSLFSGIGGMDLGLERAGMTVVGQVEIDPQCRKVLAHHWPDVRRYEDVRDVGVGRAGDHVAGQSFGDEPRDGTHDQRWGAGVDLVCGGFPCQDVSVAGKRAGLDGARSGLWFEFQRIVSELRPAYVLVENVPGLLSSNRGRDFAVILNGLGECGYAVSWAVLDAQHFGVPQRRRRVFVVAGPTVERTEAVLALCEGCAGHPAPGRTAREATTAEIGDGVAIPLSASGRGTERAGESRGQDTLVTEFYGGNRTGGALDVAAALGAHPGPHGRIDFASDTFVVRAAQTGANGHGVSDVAHTLDGANGQAVAYALGSHAGSNGERSNASHSVGGPVGMGINEEITSAIRAGRSQTIASASVRRLTPVECERLQGFPDGWTDVDGMADGPRYRMLGNAVCVPVAEYIGRRLLEVC